MTKEKISLIAIIANAVLAGGKIVVGLASSSASILAEGVHSLMDIFSSTISYAGIKIAKKPADKKHPYGHYKFEVLAGLIITIILFITGAGIIYESFGNLSNPSLIKLPILAIGVMIFSMAINEIMARLKINCGKKENSLALLSDGFHSRIDVYTSAIVIVGLIVSKYWIYADSVLAVLIGLYIIKESFSLGKEAVDSLLDVSADEETEKQIKRIAQKQNIKISSLKTQKKGSIITANLEIEVNQQLTVEEVSKQSENLRKELMKAISNLNYVTIQVKSHELKSTFYKPFLGQGFGWEQRGRFKNKLEEAQGKGPGGYCVCPECNYKIDHQKGTPCSALKCPKCKIKLERE